MADKKDEERNDILIEGSTALWSIAMDGEVNGTYLGQFRFRCFLTPTQRLAASRSYRELLGPNSSMALQFEDNMAFALTQLKYRVIEAPPFWSSSSQTTGMSGDLPDENIIMAVLDASISAELKYKAQLKEKRAEAIQKAKKAAEKLLNQRDEEDSDESKNQKSDDIT